MANTFTVLSQEQTIGKLLDDSYGPVVRIKFKTIAGTVRSIDVPVGDYNKDRIRDLLEKAAAETDEVTNL